MPRLFFETPIPASNWQRTLAGEELLSMTHHLESAPSLEAQQTIHPGPDAYVWYARVLADELEQRGLLPATGDQLDE